MRTRILRLSSALAVLLSADFVSAQERRGEERHQEEHRGPVRPAPGKFQPHPPGMHPHGPVVRQHPVRVLRPRVVERGQPAWRRWEHPEFARPSYYWEWNLVRGVTCVAEDSYGDQYP
ncbi:MAG TPA: hypothetical protein VLW85_08475, partial [Myxococcales bacterium]|nr:hypothetical protein [Myxococcales bacterium]